MSEPIDMNEVAGPAWPAQHCDECCPDFNCWANPVHCRKPFPAASMPCPFCGDKRRPNTDMVLKDNEGELFAATCQCCASQGPSTHTRGAALALWDNRTQPGKTAKFFRLFNRLNP